MLISILIVIVWILAVPAVLIIGWAAYCWLMSKIFKQHTWIQAGWAALFYIIPVGALIGLILGLAWVII